MPAPPSFPTGWGYYKSASITGASGAGTNYCIGIKVYKGAGTNGTEVINGVTMGKVYLPSAHVLDSFYDVVFCSDSSGTKLNFWQDPNLIVSGTSSVFWVQVAADLGSNATIYIFYGNSSVCSSLSNGTNTFLLFDDFTGASLDGTKWTSDQRGGGLVSVDGVNNCVLTVHPAVSIDSAGIQSIATFTHEICIMIRRKELTTPTASVAYMGTTLGSGADVGEDGDSGTYWLWTKFKSYYQELYMSGDSTHGLVRMPTSGGKTALDSTLVTVNFGNYDIFEMRYYGATGILKFICNGVVRESATDTTYYADSKNLFITQGSYYSGNYGSSANIDYVIVRPFNASGTEPVSSGTFGDETPTLATRTITYPIDTIQKKLDIIVPNLNVTPIERISNGNFETGDFTDWLFSLETNPPIISTSSPHSGTYCVDVNQNEDFFNSDNGLNWGEVGSGPYVSTITSLGFWYKNTGTDDAGVIVYFYDETINDWTLTDMIYLPANTLDWTYLDLMPYLSIDASVIGNYVVSHLNRYQEIDIWDTLGASSHTFVDDFSLITNGSGGSCNIDTMLTYPPVEPITYQTDTILQIFDVLKSNSIDIKFKKTDMLSTYEIDFSITNVKQIPYILDMDISKIDNEIEYGIDVRFGPITKTQHNYQFDTKFLLSILKAYNLDTRIIGKKTKTYPIDVEFKKRPIKTYKLDVNLANKLVPYLIAVNFAEAGHKICPLDVYFKNAIIGHTDSYSLDTKIMVHGVKGYSLDCYWGLPKPKYYFVDYKSMKVTKPTCGLDCKLEELPTRNTLKNSGGTLNFYPLDWKESQACKPAIRNIPTGTSQFIDVGTFIQETRQIEFTFRATDDEKDTMESIFNTKEQVMLWLYHQTGDYYWIYVGWLENPQMEFEYVEQTDVDGITHLIRWWKITLKLNVSGFSYWNWRMFGVS